jgi:hypothetical protein
VLGEDLEKVWPLIYDGQSDSASFDNALELLVMGGYSLAHAMMMLIPEAWAGNPLMDEERRAFYEYHMALMEPWDGPAAVAFTDGRQIGATLDRNGLRPARYLITDDDLVVMSSEIGVLPIAAGAHRQEVAPAAGQDVPDRPRTGPHHRRRRTQAHHVHRQALPQVDRILAPLRRRNARGQVAGKAERTVAENPAGLRLHAGRLQVHPRADGHPGRGSHGRHGQRQSAAGARRPGQAPVQLLQAVVRPGDESADRSDPRRNRHVADLAGQPPPEPAGCRRDQADAAPRSASADNDAGRHGQAEENRRPDQGHLPSHRRRYHDARGRRLGGTVRALYQVCVRAEQAVAARATTLSYCPIAPSTTSTRRSRRCWPARRCTSTW